MYDSYLTYEGQVEGICRQRRGVLVFHPDRRVIGAENRVPEPNERAGENGAVEAYICM